MKSEVKMMFGLSPGELIVILLVVLLLFGSTKLSGLGKSMGKSVREFKEEVRKDDDTSAAENQSAYTEEISEQKK